MVTDLESVVSLTLTDSREILWATCYLLGWAFIALAEMKFMLSFPHSLSQQLLMSLGSFNVCIVPEGLETVTGMDTPSDCIFPNMCLPHKILGCFVNTIFVWI